MVSPTGVEILLVEDNPHDAEMALRALRKNHIANKVHHVADGAAALDAVREHHPDVILLDVTMPRVDGLEVCRRLKSDPATRLTPVVLVTGQTDLSDRIRGLEAGADEFLSKPVHPHELRARVRSLTLARFLRPLGESSGARAHFNAR